MLNTFTYGANYQVVGKIDPEKLSYRGAFKPVQGTAQDLAQHISKGHPWMPAVLDRDCRREQAKANHTEILGADIDSGMSIASAMQHPFIAQHCALAIESASSRQEHEKFRLVFRLPKAVENWQQIRICNRYLIHVLGVADPACKDASRFFFGAPGRVPFILNEGAVLHDSFMQEAIAWHEAEESAARQEAEIRARLFAEQWSQNPDQKLDEIREALAHIAPYTPGEGRYSSLVTMAGGVLSDLGPSVGRQVLEEWDTGRGKWGKDFSRWLDSVEKTRPSKPATLGTVFYLARSEAGYTPTQPKRGWGGPALSEYDAYLRQEIERQKVESAQAQEAAGQSHQLRRQKFAAETAKIQEELNSLRIEPTITAEGRYIPSGLVKLPQIPGIILVNAEMGSGKTHTVLNELVSEHRAKLPNAFRGSFVPRNLLGMQSGELLGLPHHSKQYTLKALTEVTACLESIGKFPLDKLPKQPPLILFDEISQTLKQILYGHTCGNYHAFVLKRLRDLLRWVADQGGWIILSEDGITNVELDFIQQSSGLEVVDFLGFKRTEKPVKKYQIYDHPSVTWSHISKLLTAGKNIVIASDSQKWLRETEQMAIGLGVPEQDIWILDSDSSEKPWAKSFAKDPDQFVTANNPRIIGYSPSFCSGGSINDPRQHFSAMAIHLIHLEPRESKQLCDRLRTNVLRFGYVKERAASDDDLFSSCRPDLILRDVFRNADGVAKLIQFAEYAAKQNPTDHEGAPLDLLGLMERIKVSREEPSSDYGFYLNFWAKYRARETYGKLNLRSNLVKIWQAQGHVVELTETSNIKPLVEQRKDIREKLDRKEAIEFSKADASELSANEARDILSQMGATKEERMAARKRLHIEKLPGCPLDDVEFVLKVVVQENGKFLKTAELLWLAQHPEAAAMIDRWGWYSSFKRAALRDEMVWMPKLSYRTGQAKLLNECPLQPFIDGTITQWDNTTPEALAVHNWAYLHQRQFKRYFRLTIKPLMPDDCATEERSNFHTPTQTVNKLLRKLGFETKVVARKGARGDRLRQYKVTNLEDLDRSDILKALTERFTSQCNDRQEAVPESVSATCTIKTSIQNTDTPSKELFTPESLQDIRSMWKAAWEAADSESLRAVIRLFPREVLLKAIA